MKLRKPKDGNQLSEHIVDLATNDVAKIYGKYSIAVDSGKSSLIGGHITLKLIQ
ncbi:MAG: hypothetical protein OXC62_15660 [Aestuariivita sp.]|nr:hypothetical protein [Aestuariivita sp.]